MLIAPEAGGTKLRSVILSTSAPAFALALLTPLALAAGRARPEPVPTQDGADVAAPARDAMTQRDSSAVAARPVARFEREPRGAVAGRPARNPLAQRERSAATDEGRLGLELAPLDEALAAHLGLSSDARIVRGVDALGSADAAGVRRHDIVIRIDGEAPGASDSLLRARRRLARDGSLRLELVRAGRPLTLELRAHAPQTGDSQDRFRALGYVADEADASDRSQRADRPARRRSESLAGGGSRARAAENSDPDLERRTGPSGDVDLDSARDLIESARRYYERVNESDFRTDLADAAEALRRSGLESGEGRQALTQLEGLLDDGSLMETIDRSKRYLDSVDPRDFLVTLARTPDARDVDDARPTYLDRWRELDAATARDELARDRAQGPARSFERATSPQRTKDAAAWLERETELLQRLRNAEERLRAQERELDQWRRDLEDLRSRFPADSPRRGDR